MFLSIGLALACGRGLGAGTVGFPPGEFSDGAKLRVADCRGKVLVLMFYDPGLERDWMDPEVARWVVRENADRPVKFVAVVPRRTIEEVRGTPADTPDVPAFADTLRVMEARAGGKPAGTGQWRYTVIGADGKIVGRAGEGFEAAADDIDRALPDARWEYRTARTPEKSKTAADCLEYGQFERGAAMLRPLFSDRDPAVSRESRDIYARLRKELSTQKDKALVEERTDPLSAYDTYVRIAATFSNDELGRSALRATRNLKDRPEVRAELAARRELAKLDALSHPAEDPVGQAMAICREVIARYPGTPSGARAGGLLDELRQLPNSAPAARVATAFVIRIHDFSGAAGISMFYQVTPEQIAVGTSSDWRVRPKELYRAALTDPQRSALAEFMHSFPLLRLNHTYQDPTVNDGLQRWFDLTLADRVSRQIFVANRRQEDLDSLCDEVNKLLPEKLRLWKMK